MNLKLQLILRIVLATSICALLVTAHLLWRTDADLRQRAEATAERIARQLSLQLMRISTGTDLPERFPDPSVFEPSRSVGLCVQWDDTTSGARKRTCSGVAENAQERPHWFSAFYQRLFPGIGETTRTVRLNNQPRGTVTVSLVPEYPLTEAWHVFRELAGLTLTTLFGISLITYISLVRMLRPAERMVVDLARLQQGDLSYRLDGYQPQEFKRISTMINRLTEHLEQSMSVRAELTQKLMGAHEDERRWLSRELHDEVGQCLVGINALAASIRYTAERECPVLVPEAEQIERTVDHMMQLVRNVLAKLRPPELEAMGLNESVHRLVQHWNQHFRDRIRFSYEAHGDLARIPANLTGHLYRIIQESLNNAARHSAATTVRVRIETDAVAESKDHPTVTVTVEDDGNASEVIAPEHYGMGLRGIHERVLALGGQFTLGTCIPSGLAVRVFIPWKEATVIAVDG